MRYELEIFTGERQHTLTRFEYMNEADALKAYAEKRQEAGVVYASLTKWYNGAGWLLRSGGCNGRYS
jgi:hypothetical protein